MDVAMPDTSVALDGIALDDDELFSARSEPPSRSCKEAVAPAAPTSGSQSAADEKGFRQRRPPPPPAPVPRTDVPPAARPAPRWGLAVDEQEELAEIQTKVKAFLRQLPSGEQHQVVDRLLRRLAEGQPLSARRVSDRVDESCEFLAELLEFCSDAWVQEAALSSVASARGGVEAALDGSALGFLVSRRQHRLTEVRRWLEWEEHFANNGERYFYNNSTQRTQWGAPEGWPHDPTLPPLEDVQELVEPPAEAAILVPS